MTKFKNDIKIFSSTSLEQFLKSSSNILIINSNVIQPLLLKHLITELESLEFEYLDLLNKKMLSDINTFTQVLLINNRNIFNRKQLVQLFFQSNLIDYKELEKKIKNNNQILLTENKSLNYKFNLTDTNTIVFEKRMKVIFILHPSAKKLLPKKVFNYLIEKKIITILDFNNVNSEAKLINLPII